MIAVRAFAAIALLVVSSACLEPEPEPPSTYDTGCYQSLAGFDERPNEPRFASSVDASIPPHAELDRIRAAALAQALSRLRLAGAFACLTIEDDVPPSADLLALLTGAPLPVFPRSECMPDQEGLVHPDQGDDGFSLYVAAICVEAAGRVLVDVGHWSDMHGDGTAYDVQQTEDGTWTVVDAEPLWVGAS